MDVKIPVQSDDEIGKLTSAFNKMTASLGSSQSQLKEYNKTLEKQVEDRTNELNSKVTEFERVNKLMIGRELKMVELKKEIEKLKKTSVT
jgi:nitrogen fixation/metabolism regulation signal transduction histidine kinase